MSEEVKNLSQKVAEEGDMTSVDPDYRAHILILRDEVLEERRLAKESGLMWTPWRKRKCVEFTRWCSDDYHERNHKKKLVGVYLSYSVDHHVVAFLCERCFARNKGTSPHLMIDHHRWHSSSWFLHL